MQKAEESQTTNGNEEEHEIGSGAAPHIASQTRSYEPPADHQMRIQELAATRWVKAITRNVIRLPPDFPSAVDKWTRIHYAMLVAQDLVDRFTEACSCVYEEEYLKRLSKPSTWTVGGMANLACALGTNDIWHPKQQQMVYQWLFWNDDPDKYSVHEGQKFRFALYSGETSVPYNRSFEYTPLMYPDTFADRITAKSRFSLREGIKFEHMAPVRAACLDHIPDQCRHLRALVSRTVETVTSILTPSYRISGSGNWHSASAIAYAEACRQGVPGLPSGDFIMPLNRVLPVSHPMRFPWTKRAVSILHKTWEDAENGEVLWPGIDWTIQQRLLPEELSVATIKQKRHAEGLLLRPARPGAAKPSSREQARKIRELVPLDAFKGQSVDSHIAKLYVRCRDRLGINLTHGALKSYVVDSRKEKTPKVYDAPKQWLLMELQKIDEILAGLDGKIWHGLVQDFWLHLVVDHGMDIDGTRPVCLLFQCPCVIEADLATDARSNQFDSKVQVMQYQHAQRSLRLVQDVVLRNFDQMWLYNPMDMAGLVLGQIPKPGPQINGVMIAGVTNRSVGPSEKRLAINALLDYCIVQPRLSRNSLQIYYDPLKAHVSNAWRRAFPNGYEWDASKSARVFLHETRLHNLIRSWRWVPSKKSKLRLTEFGEEGWLSDQALKVLTDLLTDGKRQGLVEKGNEVDWLLQQEWVVTFGPELKKAGNRVEKPATIKDFFGKGPQAETTFGSPAQKRPEVSSVEGVLLDEDSKDDDVPLRKGSRAPSRALVVEESDDDVVQPSTKRARRTA